MTLIKTPIEQIQFQQITTAEMNALTPFIGQQVYNTDTNSFWWHDGTDWNTFGLDKLTINNNVSGIYEIDFGIDTHRLTLTGNTTFTEVNLPIPNFSKTITLHVQGDYGLILPISWNTYLSGSYDGTAILNTIVIETFGTERKVQISQPD